MMKEKKWDTLTQLLLPPPPFPLAEKEPKEKSK